MLKSIAALTALTIAGVVLFRNAVPASSRTPAGAMQTGIAIADRRAATDNGGSNATVGGGGGGGGETDADAQSPLGRMIASSGYACARILRVVAIRESDGVFEIVCRGGQGERRYRVDTRRSTAILL